MFTGGGNEKCDAQIFAEGATNYFKCFSFQVIESQNLRLEAFATLLLSQVKYLQMLYEDRQLSDESVQLINEYVKDFPGNNHLEQDNDDDDVDDVGNDDGGGGRHL